MRLSDFAPRLNGIVTAPVMPGPPSLRGIGGLGDAISDQITTYFNSFMGSLQWDVEHGMAATPDQVQSALVSAARDSCAATNSMIGSPGTCDPNSYAGLIAGYVQQYNAAYGTQVINTQIQVQSGEIAVPPSYVYVGPVVDPNALNTVAPTPVSVQTNQTGGNVLSPPVPKPLVTPDQVLNNQTVSGSTALANGTSGSNVASSTSGIMDWLTADISTSIPIPMWMALAGGLVAVLVVSKK